MGRTILFFLVTLVVLGLLRDTLGWVPILGPLLRIPLLGFWLVAVGLSAASSALASRAVERRRERRWRESLGPPDTPHAQGKLGAYLASRGQARRALPLLESAASAEPERVEWSLALGRAREAVGEPAQAAEAYAAARARDPEAGYGAATLGAARCALALGEPERALDLLQEFERSHGPSPESAFHRGRAHADRGAAERAREAWAEVRPLARALPPRDRAAGRRWAMRALLARA
jgi:tetratricopeptide (TPR) repeat protein